MHPANFINLSLCAPDAARALLHVAMIRIEIRDCWTSQ